MNYSEIVESLQRASSFDLYRLRAAISVQLEAPKRILAIRDQLHVGQTIEIFMENNNKSETAVIEAFNPTTVLVVVESTKSRWKIPYYWVNLEGIDTTLRNTAKKGIDKNALSIGETVGFRSRDGHEIYGEIIRLNPKTVTLKTDQSEWRVAYSLLFFVIDSSIVETTYIAKD